MTKKILRNNFRAVRICKHDEKQFDSYLVGAVLVQIFIMEINVDNFDILPIFTS